MRRETLGLQQDLEGLGLCAAAAGAGQRPGPDQVDAAIAFAADAREAEAELALQMALDDVLVARAEEDGALGQFGAFGGVGLRGEARAVVAQVGCEVVVVGDYAGAGAGAG